MSDHNNNIDLDRIKVVVRVRPRPLSEDVTVPCPVTVHDSHALTVTNSEQTKAFECSYDVILGENSTQEEVYSHIRDTTQSVIEGVNATVFAYGEALQRY
jgi:Kinesin motor domain